MITRTNYITVFDSIGKDLPYFEGFESMNNIYDGARFAVYNENNGTTWEVTDQAAALSTKSAWINNFGIDDGLQDELISGTIDLSVIDTLDPLIFSFDYSYNKRHAADDEELRVYISNDCGATWILRAVYDSNQLTEVVSVIPYIAIYDGWFSKKVITTITPKFYVQNFMYKMQFTNDNGNNFFLDNIKIYPAYLSDLEEAVEQSFKLYPNQTSTSLNLIVNGFQARQIRIYDVCGRLIESTDFSEEISVDYLSAGMYTLRIVDGDGAVVGTERFIKK